MAKTNTLLIIPYAFHASGNLYTFGKLQKSWCALAEIHALEGL